MNREQRAKRFTEALGFSDRWARDSNAEEATSIVLISAALDPLGYSQRKRVLKWALEAFNVDVESLR